MINGNGGIHCDNLTKDVTHLIAQRASGQKYDYARQWGIKIVSPEWYEQSLERGMVLDETLYHPLIAVAERGQGAWIRRASSTVSLGKRGRDADGVSQKARKLRRTASAKFEADTDGLWTNIVSAEPKPDSIAADQWASGKTIGYNETRRPRLVIQDSMYQGRDDRMETQTLKASAELSAPKHAIRLPFQDEGLFQGNAFLIEGFDERRAAIATRHLESHGAQIVERGSEPFPDAAFVLVPHTVIASQASALAESVPNATVVTDLWIERCLHFKRFQSPTESVTSTPIRRLPIPGFDELRISWTGFQGIDLLHLSKMVKVIGGSYHETFSAASSVLICNNHPSTEKLQHAQLWRVPAVTADWIWNCIRDGQLLPFDSYLVQPVSRPDVSSPHSTSRSTAVATKSFKTATESMRSDMTIPQVWQHSSTKPAEPPPEQSKRASTPSIRPSMKTVTNSFPDDAGPLAEESSSTLPAETRRGRIPLQETSPNSSPPKRQDESRKPLPSPPETATTTAPSKAPDKERRADSLGPAIASLLQHHQRTRSGIQRSPSPSKSDTPTASGMTTAAVLISRGSPPADAPTTTKDDDNDTATAPRRRRHRRQLLGRAPSNLSSSHDYLQDGGNNNPTVSRTVTRASSVDAANTDGLGTPILDHTGTNHSTPHKTTTARNDGRGSMFARPSSYHTGWEDDDEYDPDKPSDEHLQMTQLGYEDPDVAAWRERVSKKLAAGAGRSRAGAGAGGEAAADGDQDGNGNGKAETSTTSNDTAAAAAAGGGKKPTTTTPGRTKTPAKNKTKEKANHHNQSPAQESLGIAKRTRQAAAGSTTRGGL